MTLVVQDAAVEAIERLRRRGFDAAQASASEQLRRELNVQHNEPSLLRSSERHKLALVGLKDGRRAAAEGSGLPAPTAFQTRSASPVLATVRVSWVLAPGSRVAASCDGVTAMSGYAGGATVGRITKSIQAASEPLSTDPSFS